jgi:hypothetical protein
MQRIDATSAEVSGNSVVQHLARWDVATGAHARLIVYTRVLESVFITVRRNSLA